MYYTTFFPGCLQNYSLILYFDPTLAVSSDHTALEVHLFSDLIIDAEFRKILLNRRCVGNRQLSVAVYI